jgi:hypothetical protein
MIFSATAFSPGEMKGEMTTLNGNDAYRRQQIAVQRIGDAKRR